LQNSRLSQGDTIFLWTRLVRDYGKKKHLFGVIQQDHTEPPAQNWLRKTMGL
jgi:hypothetical protein